MKGHLRRWTIKQSFDSFERDKTLRHWTINDLLFFLQEVIKLRVDFRLFRNLRLTNKGEKDHFKALDRKNGFFR